MKGYDLRATLSNTLQIIALLSKSLMATGSWPNAAKLLYQLIELIDEMLGNENNNQELDENQREIQGTDSVLICAIGKYAVDLICVKLTWRYALLNVETTLKHFVIRFRELTHLSHKSS